MSGSSALFDLWFDVLSVAIGTDIVTERSFTPIADVLLDIDPDLILIMDFFAVHARRKDAFERLT